MADRIQIKATGYDAAGNLIGNKSAIQDRELAYHRIEKALYIGAAGAKIKLCQASDVGRVAEKVAPLGDDAALTDVIAKVNEMISALKDGGLMKT